MSRLLNFGVVWSNREAKHPSAMAVVFWIEVLLRPTLEHLLLRPGWKYIKVGGGIFHPVYLNASL